uniref:Battenin n=1 Tax=Heligmosomoides polygyrus TaxID=6339 RepID=A0A8L8KBG5_HELPZ
LPARGTQRRIPRGILGLCNNFAYVVMLSAAKDILETNKIVDRQCQKMSTGAVLLADIIPALLVKVTAPFYIHRIPFGLRHLLVVLAQMVSFIVVGTSSNVSVALFGVVVASWGSGLGEISYLALASYFDSQVISMWSSGTGGAGIIGAMAYAILTDPLMLHLSPQITLYSMLVIPVIFAYTLVFFPSSSILFFMVIYDQGLINVVIGRGTHGLRKKFMSVTPLFKYMIPLIVVYFAEYFINQGLMELLEFDCSHGFGLTPQSQYRWYQVLYQVGVFISRSSSDLIALPGEVLPVLALLQVLNATILYCEAVSRFVSHISILFCVIIYEGLLGGASYVNTFRVLHEEVPADRKEFSMAFVSISDTFGILLAGFTAIPVHNIICDRPL